MPNIHDKPGGKQLLLHDLAQQSQTDERDQLVNDVKRGRYSDFGSDSATPATDLLLILKELNYDDLYKKALRGAYDHCY